MEVLTATIEYECMDCGDIIKVGDKYNRNQRGEGNIYRYCMECISNHVYDHKTAKMLLEAIVKKPMFIDELYELGYKIGLDRCSVGNGLRYLQLQGFPAHRFKYRIQRQTSRFKTKNKRSAGCFTIWWLDGYEDDAVRRIHKRYGDWFVKKHWRDLIMPIVGRERIGTSKAQHKKYLEEVLNV